MTQLGDRRSAMRLEVVGDLRASFDVAEAARIVNRSDTGMLIASRQPFALDAVQYLHVRQGNRDLVLPARVRHIRSAVSPDGSPEYLIGVEFVNDASAAPTA